MGNIAIKLLYLYYVNSSAGGCIDELASLSRIPTLRLGPGAHISPRPCRTERPGPRKCPCGIDQRAVLGAPSYAGTFYLARRATESRRPGSRACAGRRGPWADWERANLPGRPTQLEGLISLVTVRVTPQPASQAEWRPSPPATTTTMSSADRTMGMRVSGLDSSTQVGQLRLA